MKNYRTAFIIVLVANLVLVGVLAGYWWRSHHPVRTETATTPASNPVPKQELSTSAAPPAETPLSPIQLSPERLQSIGVKFGVVEHKDLKDTIRTTGTVAIDERRISYVQTRISGHVEKVFADATYQYVKKANRYLPFIARNLLPLNTNTFSPNRMRKTSRRARFLALPLASPHCWNRLGSDWRNGTFLNKKLPGWRIRAKSERRWKSTHPFSATSLNGTLFPT